MLRHIAAVLGFRDYGSAWEAGMRGAIIARITLIIHRRWRSKLPNIAYYFEATAQQKAHRCAARATPEEYAQDGGDIPRGAKPPQMCAFLLNPVTRILH